MIPQCCADAALDGLAADHALVCPQRVEPQPDALFTIDPHGRHR